ncbi:MAG: PspC domain-containing protein [Clostridia bacterium]|nr:PspC domain-containing protein [Clostridia bacterium]
MAKQIYRSSHNAVIGGVCGGLGEYFDIDPVIMRIIWVLLLFSGVGFLAYIAAWIIIPRRPEDDYEVIEYDDDDINGGV